MVNNTRNTHEKEFGSLQVVQFVVFILQTLQKIQYVRDTTSERWERTTIQDSRARRICSRWYGLTCASTQCIISIFSSPTPNDHGNPKFLHE